MALDKAKAARLLAPAFTDPQLGKLLMLAAGHLAQAEQARTLKADADRLWEVIEALRMAQRQELEP